MTEQFLASDLFDIQKTSSHDKADLTSGSEYDYITRSVLNRGICETTGFIDEESLNEAGTFSLELMNLTFFYRERPWYAGQFVRKVIPKTKEVREQWLYFEVLFCSLQEMLKSVLIRDIDSTFNNFYFQLPIQTGSDGMPITDLDCKYHKNGYIPDWAHMATKINELKIRHVCELKAEQATKLEAYLKTTGLKEWALTELEERILQGAVKYETFALKDILDVSTSKKKFNANTVVISSDKKNAHPYVVRTSEGNGIKGFICENEKYLNAGHTFSFGQDTATVFWQEEPYFTGDKIKILTPRVAFNNRIAIYVLNVIRKAFSSFIWGQDSFNENIIKSMPLCLPIKTTKDNCPAIDKDYKYHKNGYVPDWDYMEMYIRVIEKITIANFMRYSSSVIEMTKYVISK